MKLNFEHEYRGVEFDWLAMDLDRRVALLATGGLGPVPDSFSAGADVEDAWECVMLAPRPFEIAEGVAVDFYTHDLGEIARRGVHAYSWHRRMNMYVLVARPVGVFAAPVQASLVAQRFLFSLRFESTLYIASDVSLTQG